MGDDPTHNARKGVFCRNVLERQPNRRHKHGKLVTMYALYIRKYVYIVTWGANRPNYKFETLQLSEFFTQKGGKTAKSTWYVFLISNHKVFIPHIQTKSFCTRLNPSYSRFYAQI